MSSRKQDFAIFKKFKFERQPVGVQFLFNKPKGVPQLKKTLGFCEMLPEAQKGEAFYTTKENHECAGPLQLGMVDSEPSAVSGLMGEKLGVFEGARSTKRTYSYLPKLVRNSVNYVTFAPLDKMLFDPDVFIITASFKQAEILLRASSYRTGQMWTSKSTAIVGCSWLYIYPYISGELNYMVTGICSGGMTARKVFPEGLVLISIPFDHIFNITESLKNMEWYPPEYQTGRAEANKLFNKLVKETKKNS